MPHVNYTTAAEAEEEEVDENRYDASRPQRRRSCNPIMQGQGGEGRRHSTPRQHAGGRGPRRPDSVTDAEALARHQLMQYQTSTDPSVSSSLAGEGGSRSEEEIREFDAAFNAIVGGSR